LEKKYPGAFGKKYWGPLGFQKKSFPKAKVRAVYPGIGVETLVGSF